ncbi:MFS transporter [Sphingomonas sp. MMS24-J13]|uniref:MFS transporter n=1 Tax=Sphingomonas sp. MMS24-J13 TaxID=3238686 RepID=UPI00384C3D6B
MAQAAVDEIDTLVDAQRFGRFGLSLLIWSFLATFTDGYEISALGLAVPHIVREWHVPPAQLGTMLSASLAGMFFGAPLLGLVGDRFGRRPAIAIGCLAYGVSTLAIILAHSVGQVTVLRFVTGLGMGGVLPNVIALNSESSPKRLRARLIILMFMGITLGGSMPGLVAAGMVPHHGWRAIFLVGGLAALVVGLAAPFALPESVKFLRTRPDRIAELLATLERMAPGKKLPQSLAAPIDRPIANVSIGALFTRELAPITLLLWLCFATTLMANFFLANWLPTLFGQIGMDPQTAALTSTMYHFGATFGGLAMALMLDRIGFLAVGGLLVVAVPAMLGVGLPGMSPAALGLLVAVAGFCVLGAQFGSNAAAGLIYPTACRSRGLGLAFGVGRVGSVLGPWVGAKLIGLKLSLIVMMAAASAPVLLGAVAALALAMVGRSRFGGWRLDEVPAAQLQME